MSETVPPLLLIVTAVGPSRLPFAMIAAKPPLVSSRLAQQYGTPLSDLSPVCGEAPGVFRRCATTALIKERDSSLETHLSGDY